MSKAPLIYYVEDDEHIRDLTAYALHQAGMEVRAFHDGDGLVERCAAEPPDAVLLDIMLPGDDGLVLLQALRGNTATENMPIMMLTAKGTEFDKVVGLDAGADDYLTKPFSVEELPLFGFELSEVTRDLHANGPVGVMTDYEAKFHEQGLPICRCVATMVPWEEPFPTDIRRVKNRWLDVFADGVSDAELGRHVLSDGNYLWHLFSWNLVPCLSGDAARQALSEASGEKYLFYYEEPPEGEPLVRPVTAEELVTLPADARAIPGADWYVVDKDFTWTFAQTHEADCGPYFCRKA